LCNYLNPKSEARNTKQFQMTKIPMTETNPDPIGKIAIKALDPPQAVLSSSGFNRFEH